MLAQQLRGVVMEVTQVMIIVQIQRVEPAVLAQMLEGLVMSHSLEHSVQQSRGVHTVAGQGIHTLQTKLQGLVHLVPM